MVILRSRPQDGLEIWCRCDGGPHGFLSIAAHAHADALSLEVRHDGVDILADPGTYCYHGEPLWREWFRSTAAHNTLEIRGVSQSESGALSLEKTRSYGHAELRRRRAAGTNLSAEHDGYVRLNTPTTHPPFGDAGLAARRLTVIETIYAARGNLIRLSWHLGPDVGGRSRRISGNAPWPIRADLRRATLLLPDGLLWNIRR
jgi:hypothetical protein